MKSNITLIGMPGAGKSTAGIILAKYRSYGFIDTDILIQINQQKSLQDIIDQSGYLALRQIEEAEILKLNVEEHVIATGGSAVYSDKAMTHLKQISTVVFLQVTYKVACDRIKDFEERGIAKSAEQSFIDLYNERQVLYEKYADLSIDCNECDQESIARNITDKISEVK
ncbi:MAG: shikimate kinase [PVC group bacterium]|nr:shikimate kinase [PVC group bacterium]